MRGGEQYISTDEVPLFGGARARRLRRLRRVAAGVAVLLVVLIVGGVVFVTTQRNVTTRVTLDRAVEEFRAKAGPAADVGKRVRLERAQAAVARPGKGVLKELLIPVSETGLANRDLRMPAEGVYAYRTSGGEKISVFGAKHDYPSETYATVRLLDGSRWEYRNQVIEEHVDYRTWTTKPTSIKQLSQGRDVTFFEQTEGGSMVCAPPMLVMARDEGVGAVAVGRCSDDKGQARVRRTLERLDVLRIDGRRVRAVVLKVDATISGDYRGTSDETLWLEPRTGLMLRWERHVDTRAKAFGSDIHYVEDATFVLKSLVPQS